MSYLRGTGCYSTTLLPFPVTWNFILFKSHSFNKVDSNQGREKAALCTYLNWENSRLSFTASSSGGAVFIKTVFLMLKNHREEAFGYRQLSEYRGWSAPTEGSRSSLFVGLRLFEMQEISRNSSPWIQLASVKLRTFSKGDCHSRSSYKHSRDIKIIIIVLLGLHVCVTSGRSPLGRSLPGALLCGLFSSAEVTYCCADCQTSCQCSPCFLPSRFL